MALTDDKAMRERAVKMADWKGTKQFNYQTIYAVYALPARSIH